MADKSPAFQFYPKDFLTDAKQIRLSLAAAGAYVRLMCYCWLEGSLPDDPRELARLCGASAAQMKELWPALAPCFVRQEGGTLIHPRLEKERQKQDGYRRRQSDAAKMRWHSDGTATDMPPHKLAAASAVMPPQCSSSSSSSASASPERTYAPVALAGTLPRDHIRHAWCSSRGKCVPDFLHVQFAAAVGGTAQAADQRLRAFYEAVQAGWPDGPIGDDPVKLWRQEFAAKFPSVAPTKPALPAGETAADILARRKAQA